MKSRFFRFAIAQNLDWFVSTLCAYEPASPKPRVAPTATIGVAATRNVQCRGQSIKPAGLCCVQVTQNADNNNDCRQPSRGDTPLGDLNFALIDQINKSFHRIVLALVKHLREVRYEATIHLTRAETCQINFRNPSIKCPDLKITSVSTERRYRNYETSLTCLKRGLLRTHPSHFHYRACSGLKGSQLHHGTTRTKSPMHWVCR